MSIWLSPAEIAALPASGPAFLAVKKAADSTWPAAKVSDQDSKHDTMTLAGALIAVRLGSEPHRLKTANALRAAIGTEAGGRTLALGRNLTCYVIAADLIGFREPAFVNWVSSVRTRTLDGLTLVSTHEKRATNWGTMCGAARIAADLYLGDAADLARAVQVFKGWLGDRSSYAGFAFPSAAKSWSSVPAALVPVNPKGAIVGGHSVDGALIAEICRGGAFKWPPGATSYPWGGLAGAIVQAALLAKQGYPVCEWSDRALVRAYQFLRDLQAQVGGGWWIVSDAKWQPWLVNKLCGSSFPTVTPTSPGKNMGWTDWTHA